MQTPEDLNTLEHETVRDQTRQTLNLWLQNIKTGMESTASDVTTDVDALISTLY